MRKTISATIIVAAALLAGCAKDTGRGFGLSLKDGQASWMNGVIRFSVDLDSDEQKEDNPAFEAYVKYQDGSTVHMPIDVYNLGYGASCPMGTSGLYKPEKGFENAEILDKTKEKLVIHLHHKSWDILDARITLDKQVTLYRNSPIMYVIDYYTGPFELLNIAAGLSTARNGTVRKTDNGFIIEYPNGITGMIVMPTAEQLSVKEDAGSVFLKRSVTSDQPLRYYVGLSDKGESYLLEELAKIL